MAVDDYRLRPPRTWVGRTFGASAHAARLVRRTAAAGARSHWFWRRRLLRSYGCDVGLGATVGEGLALPHPLGIVIGSGARIGSDVTIYHGVTVGQIGRRYPVVGDGCILLPGAAVLGEVVLPAGTVVGPGEVVRP